MALGIHLGMPRGAIGGGLFARNGFFARGKSFGNLPIAQAEISDATGSTRTEAANAGVLWFVTDSPANGIFSCGFDEPDDITVWTVTGATYVDLESVCSYRIGGTSYLIFGDTGNNGNAVDSRGVGIDLKLIRVAEPAVGGGGAIGGREDINCVFPAGNLPSHRDVECILADPTTGDIWVVTKRITPVKLYRLPYSASYAGTQTLIFEGNMTNDATFNTFSDIRVAGGVGGYVTGGAINPANKREIILKSYDKVFRWWSAEGESILATLQRAPNQNLVEVYVGGGITDTKGYGIHPNGEPQGETLAFLRNGLDFVTASESIPNEGSGASSFPLFYYKRLPRNPTIVSFQQGTNGYTGSLDTTIDSQLPALDGDVQVTMIADENLWPVTNVATASAGTMIDITIGTSGTTDALIGGVVQLSGMSVSGYNGYWVVNSKPTGTTVRLVVAFNGNATGMSFTRTRQGMIKWDTSIIPVNKTVVGAYVDWYISTEGISLDLRKMLINWAVTDNWNTRNRRITPGTDSSNVLSCHILTGVGVNVGIDGYVGFFRTNLLVSDVQDWVSNPSTNYGLVIEASQLDSTGDGIQVDSNQGATVGRHPKLTIQYI